MQLKKYNENNTIQIFNPSSDFGHGLVFSLFNAYEIENKNNSLTRTHATAKGLMEELIERPLTIQSFITYCYEFGGIDVYHLFNGGKVDAEYRSVINYIRSKCASQQVEQALIGNYNAGLVQRLNSIKETIEIHEVQELPLINLPD